MRRLLPLLLALGACSPVEPRDAGIDRRSPSPDAGAEDVADELDPVVFDVQPIDASDAGDVLDARAPMDARVDARSTPDTGVDARETGPDARDAGVDAPDVVCPPDGFGGYQWEPCTNTACCQRGRCGRDIDGRPYCQG